jgi:hypothetical protein
MKKKKDRNLQRVQTKKRIRGTPMFDPPKPVAEIDTNLVKEPESIMDVARLLADEIKKKWPDAQTPSSLAGKHAKLSQTIVEEFGGEVIRSMIRVLVWDFEEIKKNKAFFPPSNHLNWPWIDQLYNYRHALASVTTTGITDSTSRISAYAQKYLKQEESSDTGQGESLKDIAKKLLGQ